MGKMNEMSQAIADLRSATATISDVANWLTQQFSGEDDSKQQIPKSTIKEEPIPKPILTLEQVRAVLAEKSRAGHTAEIRELLKKYGASKLSAVDPANYKALMKDAEVLGDGK
ncbi:MAG: DNA ligase [Oscillospiraceae bacterium]|nr:DNA ligase [Oscillospiraceae bacterium]